MRVRLRRRARKEYNGVKLLRRVVSTTLDRAAEVRMYDDMVVVMVQQQWTGGLEYL